MNQELQHQIFTRLDALAQKLNIAGGQIWQFYVAQARVEAWQDFIAAVVLLIAAIILTYLCIICIRKLKHDDDYVPGVVFSAVGAIGCFIGSLNYLSCALTPWLNPNYWAFQQLISTIMGHH